MRMDYNKSKMTKEDEEYKKHTKNYIGTSKDSRKWVEVTKTSRTTRRHKSKAYIGITDMCERRKSKMC